jgi:hypothetical protein
MNMEFLHDKTLAWVNENGDLCIDLLAIAVKVGAPLTTPSISHIGLLVQRYFRQIYPDIECEVDMQGNQARSGGRLRLPHFDLDHPNQIPKG